MNHAKPAASVLTPLVNTGQLSDNARNDLVRRLGALFLGNHIKQTHLDAGAGHQAWVQIVAPPVRWRSTFGDAAKAYFYGANDALAFDPYKGLAELIAASRRATARRIEPIDAMFDLLENVQRGLRTELDVRLQIPGPTSLLIGMRTDAHDRELFAHRVVPFIYGMEHLTRIVETMMAEGRLPSSDITCECTLDSYCLRWVNMATLQSMEQVFDLSGKPKTAVRPTG